MLFNLLLDQYCLLTTIAQFYIIYDQYLSFAFIMKSHNIPVLNSGIIPNRFTKNVFCLLCLIYGWYTSDGGRP